MQKLVSALATLAAGLALISLSPPAFAAWDLQQLMDSLAQNKSGRATFVETKRIAMLDKPVESSGELLFTAPDRLEKRTLKPKPESMIVDGDALLRSNAAARNTSCNCRPTRRSPPSSTAFAAPWRATARRSSAATG